MKQKSMTMVLVYAMLIGVMGVFNFTAYAAQVDQFLIQGTETEIATSGTNAWGDLTGGSSANTFSYQFSTMNGILDYYVKRKTADSKAYYYTQLYTPNATKMGDFIAQSTTNYISVRMMPSAPSGTQTYETAITLGYYGSRTNRLPMGELMRFKRNGKICYGGTPSDSSISGETEIASFAYDQWYTATFRLDTSQTAVTGKTSVVATILDETNNQTYTSASYDVDASTTKAIDNLRFMLYPGYSGNTNDDLHVYIDYMKVYRIVPDGPTYTLDFYNGSVATENKITIPQTGTIIGNATLDAGFWSAIGANSLNFIMAVYRNQELVGLSIVPATNTDSSITTTVPDVQAGDTVMWFTWNDTASMSPLMKAKVFDSNGLNDQ